MTLFGLDISHHQSSSLNLAQCRNEGVEFIFLKATEGSTFVDPAFVANLNKARAAGLLVGAYHYVRSNATVAAQVMNVVRTISKDVPVILDVEANSGGVGPVREMVAALRAAGYTVPLLYLPRWYWQQIGSPSLVGLPPLWSSRYPDNVVGTLAGEYAAVPASYWNGYGGLGVTVLQFTSSARVAGHQPLDANAFQGTREQLAAVLGEEDDVSWNDTWTFTPAGSTTPISVKFGDMVGNMFAMKFYGSDSEPWRGASEVAMLKDLVGRQLADVDEEALAEALEARGIVGITPQQVKEVVQSVFRDAGDGAGPPVTGV